MLLVAVSGSAIFFSHNSLISLGIEKSWVEKGIHRYGYAGVNLNKKQYRFLDRYTVRCEYLWMIIK